MCRLLNRLLWRFLGLVTALAAAPVLAADGWAQVAYEPMALGWSASEVERTTAANMHAIVLRAERDGLLGCRRSCERLGRIFERLVPMARAQTARSARLPWSLTVVRSTDFEAMALPGGQVLISEAFVDVSGLNDEAIAFVLGHEMSHSILEHERQTLHFARMLLPRDVPRSVADMYAEIDYSFTLLKSLEPVLQQGELEADELGLLLASSAGFDPQRQLGFVAWEAERSDGATLVQTHPPAQQRLERLRLRLPLANRLYTTGQAAGHEPAEASK